MSQITRPAFDNCPFSSQTQSSNLRSNLRFTAASRF
jgi:hypothetical protein